MFALLPPLLIAACGPPNPLDEGDYTAEYEQDKAGISHEIVAQTADHDAEVFLVTVVTAHLAGDHLHLGAGCFQRHAIA